MTLPASAKISTSAMLVPASDEEANDLVHTINIDLYVELWLLYRLSLILPVPLQYQCSKYS